MGFKPLLSLRTTETYTLGGENQPTQVEGYFLGSEKIKSDINERGYTLKHVFQTSRGNIGVWGKGILDAELAKVPVGVATRVTFTGMIPPTKKGRRPAYGYSVEIDSENTIDAPALTTQNNVFESQETEEVDFNEDDNATDAIEYTPAPRRPTSIGTTSGKVKTAAELLASRKNSA